MSFFAPFNCIEDVREITLSALTFDKSAMISSVRPSLKYPFSASGLRFANGSTTRTGARPPPVPCRRTAPEAQPALQCFQFVAHVPRGLNPAAAILFETPPDQPAQLARQIWSFFGGRRGRVAENRGRERRLAPALKWPRAGRHLMKHYAQREDVRARIHAPPSTCSGDM